MKQTSRPIRKIKKSLCFNLIHTMQLKEYPQHKQTTKDDQRQKHIIYQNKKPDYYPYSFNFITETNYNKVKYECNTCLKVFYNNYNYKNHLKIHGNILNNHIIDTE